MTEILTKLSWGLLVLIHTMPAAVVFRPALLDRLYGVEPSGDLGLLMVHRGALFLAVAVVCAYAAFSPNARRAAGIVAAISVGSFLLLYSLAGLPAGSLRGIAIGDVLALLPLLWVLWAAWRP